MGAIDYLREVKRRDVRIHPKFQEEFTRDSTGDPTPVRNYGGTVRRTPRQQEIIDHSLYNTQRRKKAKLV